MGQDKYSRRRFLRRSATLAAASLAWPPLRSSAQAAEENNPKTPDEALKELTEGNERYVSGEHTHHEYGPERPSLALTQRPFAAILAAQILAFRLNSPLIRLAAGYSWFG